MSHHPKGEIGNFGRGVNSDQKGKEQSPKSRVWHRQINAAAGQQFQQVSHQALCKSVKVGT